MNTTTQLVLLFNTAANPAQAARVHVANCRMVNTTTRGGVVKSERGTLDELRESIADLEKRIYPVRFCKCTKGV